MEIVYNLDQWKIFLEGVFLEGVFLFLFFLNKVKHLFTLYAMAEF